VSRYDERDGWIDGYIDLWLDDSTMVDLTPPAPLPSQGRGEQEFPVAAKEMKEYCSPLLAGEGLGERSKKSPLLEILEATRGKSEDEDRDYFVVIYHS